MAHELDSAMLCIHPPLAISGYILAIVFTTALFSGPREGDKRAIFLGLSAWLLTLLGLLTGMLWAHSAWGSWWSWDPKETSTLAFFLALTGALAAELEGRRRWARALGLLSCALIAVTASTSLWPAGLHSFL